MSLHIGIHSAEQYERHNSAPILERVIKKADIRLRDYQLEAFEAIFEALKIHQSTLCVLATGLGKTVLFSKIIESWSGRVLVLVHLEELLQNASQEIGRITGEHIGIERQRDFAEGERVVVALIHSLVHRLERFPRDYFGLIICDEAHHCTSSLYTRIFSHFGGAKRIGLTATDQRADGGALPFNHTAYRIGIQDGINKGYLVPVRGKRITLEAVELRRVRVSGSDFNQEALDDEMVKGAAAIADVIYNDFPFDKGILFFPGCASARLVSEFLNEKHTGISVYIDGKITGDSRRSLIKRLRDGSSSWLCNVGIATEGFNWPECSVVGMCAPTTSRAAYVQRAGRGTRSLEGLLNGLSSADERKRVVAASAKPYMTILDFVGVSANLDLVSYEGVLNGEESKASEPDNDRNERSTDDNDCEPSEGQSRGINILGNDFVRNVESTTSFISEGFDPFEPSRTDPGGVGLKTGLGSTELTEKQFNLLNRWLPIDRTTSRSTAQKMIGFAAQRNFRLSETDKKVLKQIYEQNRRTESSESD